MIHDEGFKSRHRRTKQAFTRNRSLSFAMVLMLLLRKGVKSLQNQLNEALSGRGRDRVTASAYSQARYKLKHEAFIELNREAVVNTLYADSDYRTFWGFRLLAVDGSQIRLPDTEAVRETFGTQRYTKGKTDVIEGAHPYALASVLYDVLNRVALDATLDRTDAYEVDLCVAHLEHTHAGDLLVMDRNYPSYRMLAELHQRQRDFVIRCSKGAFTPARRMLRGDGAESQIVTLHPCAGQVTDIRRRALPSMLTVRFVRVRLKTGEWEVLVTSLRDETRYPTPEFGTLYRWRWGIETFYGLLKTRLELENFSGTQPEAVKQDFFATVYLCGLESLLTESAQEQLNAKNTRHAQKVNRAVSFNAIKHHALTLLMEETDPDVLLQNLTRLFLMNPSLERAARNPPRKHSSPRLLLDFHKRRKKHCY